MRTWISPTSPTSPPTCNFKGEALPDWVAVELGDGYRIDASMEAVVSADMVCGGSEGDRDRTDRGGDEDSMDGVAPRSDRGEDGVDEVMFLTGVSMIQSEMREVASASRLPWR